jgi:hypothetical protein
LLSSLRALDFQQECHGRLSNGLGLVNLSSGRERPRKSQWRIGFSVRACPSPPSSRTSRMA